jgi:hypothetical protein
MITNALISLAVAVLNGILFIFPASLGFPQEVFDAVDYFSGFVGMLDPIVPISTLATVVGLIVTFELAVFSFKGLKWLFSHIPFVGGRG